MARVQLIARAACARIVGVHPNTWDSYWRQHMDLVKACRTVRVDPKRAGRRKWILSEVEKHAIEECR